MIDLYILTRLNGKVNILIEVAIIIQENLQKVEFEKKRK